MSSEDKNRNFFRRVYEDNYKALLIIPFILLLLGIGLIFWHNAAEGSFVSKGITLKGGTSLSVVSEEVSEEELRSVIDYEGDVNYRTLSSQGREIGVVLEMGTTNSDTVDNIKSSIIENFNVEEDEISVETMGSSLGESFFQETVQVMIIAFVFMAIVVFIYFRTFVPSIAVILAAVSDILVTIAIVNLIGVKLSSSGIAAFLMLIGYSVDTDILLSTKVLKKRQGELMSRIYEAMKTGMMMSFTTISALVVALIYSNNEVISQIMLILVIGLAVDLINTWIQNVGILRLYLEKRRK